MPPRSLSVRASVQILLRLCFSVAFFFSSSATSSSVGIVLRGCLTNPHSVPFLLGKKRSTRSSYPLLSWRSIEMQVVLASQLAYPMILFVFFLAGSGRPPLLNYLLLVSCMACTQDGGHDLLSSWLFFSFSFFLIYVLFPPPYFCF